jgi:glycosyltransferase involved in cell wall biosynthesis
MLRGQLDFVSLRLVSGWVQDTVDPEDPVSLIVTDNDRLITRVLANRYREDLKEAAMGSGRHSFELALPQPLSPLERHVVRVCREIDGIDIPGSPVTIEPSRTLEDDEKEMFAGLLGRLGTEEELARAMDFLTRETDRLTQRLADLHSKRAEREESRQFLRRWRQNLPDPDAPQEPPRLSLRALVIDDRIPKSDRDAGSNAILAHMQSLQRLGYEVVFVPADQFVVDGPDTLSLQAIGATSCLAPLYCSVEDVMRRQADTFDLVYFHRISNASKYLTLARHYFPKARLIYSVADLHHVRFARQATAEDRPELIALSKRVRLLECVATATADAVITHSPFEADLLRKEVRGANVHVVPWTVTAQPTEVPFAKRGGVAFIGGFGHAPNQDAARWLISEIMPLVRKRSPKIECLLVGSEMPESLLRLCENGIVAVGHVDTLAKVFDRVRLTVAPLSYGAGIKGKVIESLAAGVPCICTPVAAEGLDLPEAMRVCIADDAAAIAATICDLHGQESSNEACRVAGLAYVAANFPADRLDQLMRKVVEP